MVAGALDAELRTQSTGVAAFDAQAVTLSQSATFKFEGVDL